MKIIIFLLVTFFSIDTTQAQLIKSYGLKIGTTGSNQYWDYTQLTDFAPETRWGINAGVFTEFLSIPYFSLVTELNYAQKGMKDKIGVTTPQSPDIVEYITWDTRIDYINLSALGKIRLDLGVFVPYILFGPKIDFEINVENSPDGTNVVAENLNEIIYGFKIGIGSEINLESFSLLAEILYEHNISQIYEGEYLTVNSDSFDFRVGIMF